MSGARVILFGGKLGDELGDEPDDVALVEALRRRDARAELIAWRRFAPTVSRTVRRLAGPRCDEEDLSQEVFLHFFRSIGALREPSAVRSFLTGICIRVVRREVRGRWLRRWLLLTDQGALPEVAAPLADPGVREAVARYYAILDRLASQARSLFVARHLEGLGLVEVAALHRLSVSTTQRRLARAEARVAVLTGGDPAIAAYLNRDSQRGPGR